MESHDLSVIYVKDDGSFIIDHGLYHVPNEGEFAELWSKVNQYVKEHPESSKTLSFSIGDIFNVGYPAEAAMWCNDRGDCYIDEIEPAEDGVRRFEIKTVPEPTAEQLAQQARTRRDALIAETDYLMMPDYPIPEEDRTALESYRQALRDIPQSEGFPETINWPEIPATLSKKVTYE